MVYVFMRTRRVCSYLRRIFMFIVPLPLSPLYIHTGAQAEGYSGSDIAVVVREALMEPLRKCQFAKQFIMDAGGMYHPCVDYPNCPSCPMMMYAPVPGVKSVHPDTPKNGMCGLMNSMCTTPYCVQTISYPLFVFIFTIAINISTDLSMRCAHCGAERLTLYDIPSEKLAVPLITFDDFQKALGRAHSSVGADELGRFESWTSEFGQEG